jgi:hypothetical protein
MERQVEQSPHGSRVLQEQVPGPVAGAARPPHGRLSGLTAAPGPLGTATAPGPFGAIGGPEPLGAAIACLERRWGSAAVRLGDGAAASALAGRARARLGFPLGGPGASASVGSSIMGGTVTAGIPEAAGTLVEGALAPALLPEVPPPDPLAPLDDRVVSTGFPALDAILGPGGLVREAQVTLRGDASSGKTTLALRLVAEAQARGAIAAWLDLAHAFDPLEAVARGVDLAWLLVLRAVDATEGLRLAGALLGGRAVELLVADLPERLPVDRETLLRRLAARARQAGARLITLEPSGLAPPLRGALAESAGIGLDLERRAWIRAGRDVVGQRTEVTVAKNRFGPPGRRVELEIRYTDDGDRARGVARVLDEGPPVLRVDGHRAGPPGSGGARTHGGASPPGTGPASIRRPVSLPEHTIGAVTHAIPPSRLAPSAAPPRADLAPAPGPGRARRQALGAGPGAGLQPGRAAAGHSPGDAPRRGPRPRP